MRAKGAELKALPVLAAGNGPISGQLARANRLWIRWSVAGVLQ